MPIRSLALQRYDEANYWVRKEGDYTPFACHSELVQIFAMGDDLDEIEVCWSKDKADVPTDVDAVEMLLYGNDPIEDYDGVPIGGVRFYLLIKHPDGWEIDTEHIGQYVELERFLTKMAEEAGEGVGVRWVWLRLPKKGPRTVHDW